MAISSNGLAGLKPGVVDNAAARPSSPFEGQLVYEKDVDMLAIWNGTEWGYIYSSSGNLIINGAMQVTQRSAVGTAVTGITASGYYTADRFRFGINLGTWTQTTIADAPTGSGFRNSLKIQPTTASATAAGSVGYFTQSIEGQNLQALRKGTASAQTVTLSFWVKAFQTGTYICEFQDANNNRFVSKSYTITTSGTWQYVTVLFPADTTGAFTNDNNGSLVVYHWLLGGSDVQSGTLQTTWGTLVTANRAVGQTNVASSTSNYWQITGTQLTVGSVATPFEFKSFADDLAACQRYYQRVTSTGGDQTFAAGMYLSSTQPIGSYNFSTMRVAPTMTFSGSYDTVTNGAAVSTTSLSGLNATTSTIQLGGTCSGATAGGGTVYRQDSGYFDMSAEL